MIKIHIHKSTTEILKYFSDHLQKSQIDYYNESGIATTRTFGKLLERLGISNLELSAENVESLIKGINPFTGESLRIREKDNARSGYDCVFSDPKSVSILALVMDDLRIHNARLIAYKETLIELQKLAKTRVRSDGKSEDRNTGEILAMSFEHFTSRENDPQCHFHTLIPNYTFDDVEKRFKAIQMSEIYRSSGFLTEVYRNVLVRELNKIGYATVPTKNGFEIKGVPRTLIDKFSKRHAQIINGAEKAKKRGKVTDIAKLKEEIARCTRKAKKSHPREVLRLNWLNQLTPNEFNQLMMIKAKATGPIMACGKTADESLEWAKKHLFERSCVVRKSQLLRDALKSNRGINSLQELELALNEQIKNGSLISKGDEFTTPEIIAMEKELISLVDSEISSFKPFSENFLISGGLTQDQLNVVSNVLLSTSRVTAVRGPAGSGKTTTLKEMIKGLRSTGNDVMVIAPTSSAVEVIRKDEIPFSETLQRFLTDEDLQIRLSGGTVVLDEAGMCSLGQMLSLVKTAKERNIRLILLGDTSQHTSVEKGDALRLLEQWSKMPKCSLAQIQRQKGLYKSAVEHLKNGDGVSGFDTLDSMGWIPDLSELSPKERNALLAEEFTECIKKGETAISVAPTLNEVAEINASIRDSLKKSSLIKGKDFDITVLVPAHKTLAERSDSNQFAEGEIIQFIQDSRLFERGECVTVTGSNDGLLMVKRANGQTLPISPEKYSKNFSVFTTSKIQIATGDRLLLKANGKSSDGKKLINGQIVTVKSIKGESITLEDGRTIPASYRTFSLGYSVTSHASQGKTVSNVFLSSQSSSGHTAMSFESFYVSVSRGRKSCKIFTDSKINLREAIAHSSARKTATELLHEMETTYEPPNPTPPTNTKPDAIPANLKLASPILKHPGSSSTPARDRSPHHISPEPPHTQHGGVQNSMSPGTTGKADLQGRQPSNDKLYGSSMPRPQPKLGRDGKVP